MTAMQRVLVWHRNDLRLSDNPALFDAVESNAHVQPVFILDDKAASDWAYGGASKWWLHHSLTALQAAYKKHGITLLLRRGDSQTILQELAKNLKADRVVWNRRYEPHFIKQDTDIKSALIKTNIIVDSFPGNMLFEPWQVQTKSKTPFRVFTPFWKQVMAQDHAIDADLPAPDSITPIKYTLKSDVLKDWGLLPTKPNWAKSFEPHWTPGEESAQQQLGDFLDDTARDYSEGRDYPSKQATSRLSPHLAFGEISPRQIWHTANAAIKTHKKDPVLPPAILHFLREVGWRDFAYHLLYHYPQTPTQPLYPAYADFPWLKDNKGYKAWTKGLTGYPIVDAGMRELWQTGVMHNRVRMIVASFLVKDLLLPWQDGARWFWDTLVDADLANNTLGWQWSAGCGADAAPYFRIFNPSLQSAKFDPKGDYIRTYVPEIASLPDKYLHAPWTAPADILKDAGITLGKTYPKPVVDHKLARDRALAALKQIKNEST